MNSILGLALALDTLGAFCLPMHTGLRKFGAILFAAGGVAAIAADVSILAGFSMVMACLIGGAIALDEAPLDDRFK